MALFSFMHEDYTTQKLVEFHHYYFFQTNKSIMRNFGFLNVGNFVQ